MIETNGLIRLDELLADIRLVATGEAGWNVFLGGTLNTGRAIGFVSSQEAAQCVVALLDHFASLGRRREAGRSSLPAFRTMCCVI